MTKTRHYFRILKRTLWYGTALLVVLAAVLASVLRLFLPELTGYRTQLEEVASAFLEHTVRIESMDARLVGFTPTLIFNQVRLVDEATQTELAHFDQARLGLAMFESLVQRRVVPRKFIIEGIQLVVTRHVDGTFQVQGMDASRFGETLGAGEPRNAVLSEVMGEATAEATGEATGEATAEGGGQLADWLFQRSSLALHKSTVIWKDLKRDGQILQFNDVNLVLRNRSQRHQLTGHVSLPAEMGKYFEIAMDVTGDILNPQNMQGKVYVRGDSIHLDKWGVQPAYLGVTLHTGMADFQLWGSWKDNAIEQLSGDVTFYNVNLSLPVMEQPYQVKLLGSLFDVQRHARGWDVRVDRFQYLGDSDVWPETRFTIKHEYASPERQAQWAVNADYIRLEDISTLLLKTTLLDAQQRRMLQTMQPSGDVRRLQFVKSGPAQASAEFAVQAEFQHLSARPWQAWPGLNGVQGMVQGDTQQGRLQLHSDFATLEMPRLFRKPLRLNQFDAQLNWRQQDEAVYLWTEQLRAGNADLQTRAELLLMLPSDRRQSPYMDLQVAFNEGNAAQAGNYYPVGIMPSEVVNWLDRSIVAGRINSGGAVFNGRLRDFPFAAGQGQFKVEFAAEDVVLNYQPGWPALSQAGIKAGFTGSGMHIDIEQARLFGSAIRAAQVSIPHFARPVLNINGQVDGGLDDVARFLVNSPVAPGARSLVEQARFQGRSQAEFSAAIPLSKAAAAAAPLRYAGQVQVQDGAIYLLQDKLDITAISGQVQFDQHGQRARGVQARVFGSPAVFELQTQTGGQTRRLNLLASGELDVGKVAQRFEVPGRQRIQGTSTWHGAMVLDMHGQTPPLLQLSAGLQDVAIDLPPPLGKPAGSREALMLQAQFIDAQHTQLQIDYEGRLSSRLEFNTQGNQTRLARGHLHLAEGEAQLPDTPILHVTGALDGLRVADWRAAFSAETATDAGSSPAGVAVPRLPLQIDLERLVVLPGEPAPLVEPLAEPLAVAPRAERDYPPPPSQLAGISGRIQSLTYGAEHLGTLEFAVRAMSQGLRLQQLALQGDNLKLNATGDWRYQRNRHHTALEYQLASPDMGKLLDSLGFSAVIQGGDLSSQGRLEWAAPPHGFSVGLTDGELELRVRNGSIVKVRPGAGRLLGLFSLSALPRRLMLDFRDTFQEGFSFDEMSGDMQIQRGNVHTENLRMISPLAEIRMVGRTGMAARDFDQQITVTPKVSDSLPVAGGLLFGAQVGAVILFFEKLFSGSIEKASARRYHVTGSWEEPVIVQEGQIVAEPVSE